MAYCDITQNIIDIADETIDELTITVKLVNPTNVYDNNFIDEFEKTFISVDGVFTFSLLETESIDANSYYIFTIPKNATTNYVLKKTIPTLTTASSIIELPDYVRT